MGKMLHALGVFCGRLPLVVIAIWFVVVAGVFGAVAAFGSETSNDLNLPGTGSQQVQDLLTARFPPQQNGINPILFHVSTGKLTDKANAAAVKSSTQALRKAPHVYSVTNPLNSNGQAAGLLSKDGRTAFAPVLLDVGSGVLDTTIAQRVFDATRPAKAAGIEVAAAGSIGSELSDQPTESSELVGILAAMFILTLVLGSLVAMGLPIIGAVGGLASALGIIGLLGHLVSMPDTGATLATMIGLGVGIDYALFLISQHQDQIAAGVPIAESIPRAVATAGGAILFAGSTVVVALLSLRVAGIPLLSTLGLASAVAVVTAVFSAITLLPAILALLGHRVSWLSLPSFLHRRGGGHGAWATWAGFVTRHPVWITVGSLALLVPLIVPALSLRFGQEDIGASSPSTTERQAYDLTTAGFGVGYNGPLQVASQFDPVVAPSKQYTSDYNEATSLQKDLEKKQKQLPKQQKQLQSQQKQLEREQAQLQSQQRGLLAQQQQLQAEQQHLVAQQHTLEQEKATLQQQATALQQRAAALPGEKARLLAQQRHLESQKAQLLAERNRLEQQARALAARIRPLARQLAGILVRERALERRIAKLDGHPARQAILRALLDALKVQEQHTRAALAPLEAQARDLAGRARALAARAAQLQRQADQLQAQANHLTAEAEQLTREKAALDQRAAALQQQADSLQAQGAQLQQKAAALQQQGDALQHKADLLTAQAAQLQTQADQLKSEQQTAKQEQKQAEQLQKQLTAMVTTAGGDPRNTDPRVVRLQQALTGTAGVASLTLPQTNKKGDVGLL
ncbi:MAG: putative drug exporter of the superfamily, partial [Nocardioidaceae bacterium]|nr:putative drug exporter of the superfamily [Nocardioidaceae bacterium]